MNEALKELEQLYPDKIVYNLGNYPNLRYRLVQQQKNEGYDTLDEYLSNYNFVYGRNAKNIKDEQDLLNLLIKDYPDKCIGKVSEIKYYHLISSVAKAKHLKATEWLQVHNFILNRENDMKGNSGIYVRPARILKERFNITYSKIGEYFGVSKQRVEQILKKGKMREKSSILNEELSVEIENVLIEMVQRKLFTYSLNDIFYEILNSINGDFCFIWKIGTSFNMILKENLPMHIKNMIEETKMDRYTQEDYILLENIEIVHVLKKPCIVLATSESKRMFDEARKSHKPNLTANKYCDFIGVTKIIGLNEITDERIVSFFKDNLREDGVYISSSSENQWFRNYISRCKMSDEEMINYMGFQKSKYKSRVNFEERKLATDIELIEELKDYIIQGPNIVFIHSESNIYSRIIQNASTRNYSIDEYLEYLGYKRVLEANAIRGQKQIVELSKTIFDEINEELQANPNINNKKTVTVEQRKRNKELVRKLKEHYKYKCQLCTQGQLFNIEKQEDIFYVEVHHIKPLSEEDIDDFTGEQELLDVVENMIVVCANHHRYLHYHHGGNFKLSLNEEEMCLENDKGDRIAILRDNHLRHRFNK